MSQRVAFSIIAALLLVHVIVVALLVYALVQVRTVSFPLVPRTSGATPAANGASASLGPKALSITLREALSVVPARGSLSALSPAVTNQPAGSRFIPGAGFFSHGFPPSPWRGFADVSDPAASSSAAAAGGLQFIHPTNYDGAARPRPAAMPAGRDQVHKLAMAVSASHAAEGAA